eukprot:Platyproteum_vivax@DN8574_c0_g1_i1.p1
MEVVTKASDCKPTIKKLKTQFDKLESQIRDVRRKCERKVPKLETYKKAFTDTENQIKSYKAQIKRRAEDIDSTYKLEEDLTRDVGALRVSSSSKAKLALKDDEARLEEVTQAKKKKKKKKKYSALI